MTRVELILERLRDTLADSTEERYKTPHLLRLISEGQRLLARTLNNVTVKTTIAISPAQVLVNLPGSALVTDRAVLKNTEGEILKLLHLSHLDADLKLGANWELDVGTPVAVIYDYLPIKTLKLAPIPDKSFTLELYHSRLPASLTAVTDLLEVGEECDLAIKFYATGMALRESLDTQNRQMGSEELSLYSTELRTLQTAKSKDNIKLGSSPSTEYRSAF